MGISAPAVYQCWSWSRAVSGVPQTVSSSSRTWAAAGTSASSWVAAAVKWAAVREAADPPAGFPATARLPARSWNRVSPAPWPAVRWSVSARRGGGSRRRRRGRRGGSDLLVLRGELRTPHVEFVAQVGVEHPAGTVCGALEQVLRRLRVARGDQPLGLLQLRRGVDLRDGRIGLLAEHDRLDAPQRIAGCGVVREDGDATYDDPDRGGRAGDGSQQAELAAGSAACGTGVRGVDRRDRVVEQRPVGIGVATMSARQLVSRSASSYCSGESVATGPPPAIASITASSRRTRAVLRPWAGVDVLARALLLRGGRSS